MLGQTFGGRYHVTDALGRGGFGSTYIAEDIQRPGSPRCVLKVLRFQSEDPDLLAQVRRMFAQEAETLEKLGEHDQIPRLLASFEENNEFYLVQELIEGESLSQVLKPGYQLHEAEVIALLDDVLGILEFVHGQQVIHRDIKPENLIRRSKDHRLVLIDFGAVKTLDTLTRPVLTDLQPSIPVYTTGYAASELCLGQPRYASDLYALGVIGVQAVTGMHPSQMNSNPQTCELEWRDHATTSDRFAAILSKLIQFHFNDRYANAGQVRQALKTALIPPTRIHLPGEETAFANHTPTAIETPIQPPKSLPWKWIAGGTAAAAALTGGIWVSQQMPQVSQTPSIAAAVRQQISSGERVLTNDDSASKQNGTEHLAAGQNIAAIAALEKNRSKDRADPETLIYLNNARIPQKSATYTIAAVLPFKTQTKTANEVLRGIAQIQDQLNQSGGINGKLLKIRLADDQNKPDMAKQIASALVEDPTVLGVIGHGSSDATLAAAEVYKKAELVAIAPLSSAVKLSGFSPFLFRTMPSDQLPAKQLADYVATKLKKKRVAIIYNASNTYSNSLKDEFKNAFFYSSKGEIVSEIDLNQGDFDPADSLKALNQAKAEVILLATNGDKLDQALLLAQLNSNKLPLIGGDALYSSKTLKTGGKSVTGLVIAVPVEQISLDQSRFQQQAKKLWGEGVSWRSALGYDATRALATALTQTDSRRSLQSALSNREFHAIGATQSIKFTETGDRKGAIQLLRIAPGKNGGNEFVPLK
jgi:eukaryotic-like serine/threonine-protein kinase